MNIKKLVKPNIRSLNAYHAEEIPCAVKLDANESPYGTRVLGSVRTNKYPDPEAKALRKLVAKNLRIKAENILHGNGSDELINCIIATFGGPVLYPVPTFSMYGIIAQTLGEKRIEIPLNENYDLDDREMLKAIKERGPKVIFLSSPNNPTGNSFSRSGILKIIKKSKGIVVVDEAYQPFSDKKSFLQLTKEFKNLIVLRTLSKVGLAGLRIGFMVSNRDITEEVNKVRLPFNVNSLSQTVAINTLNKGKQFKSDLVKIVSERKKLYKAMTKMSGIKAFPSDANFIFFKTDIKKDIYNKLLKKGVLIRDMRNVSEGCLRVTVGTASENRAFLQALSESM